MRQGRIDEARLAMRRETAAFPRNREAWIRLAASYTLAGNVQQSENVLSEMILHNPDDSSYRMIADAYRGLGQGEMARRWEARERRRP